MALMARSGLALRAPPTCSSRLSRAAAARPVAPRRCRVVAAAPGSQDADQPRSSAAGSLRALATPLLDAAMDSDAEAPRCPVRRPPPVLALRVDGAWYDCSAWAREHPGGAMFVALFNGELAQRWGRAPRSADCGARSGARAATRRLRAARSGARVSAAPPVSDSRVAAWRLLGRDATDLFYAFHSYGANGALRASRARACPRCAEPPPRPQGVTWLPRAWPLCRGVTRRGRRRRLRPR